MKIKQFRDLLVDLPDDTEVVVSAPDHSYQRADGVYVTEAVDYNVKNRRSHLGEYYGSPNEIDFNETPDAAVIKVVVLS